MIKNYQFKRINQLFILNGTYLSIRLQQNQHKLQQGDHLLMETQYTNSQTANDQSEQTQPVYMWTQYSDAMGNLQWTMIPEYYYFFQNFLEFIKTLKQTVNKKWKPQQHTAYQTYLFDLENYINSYIFTGQVVDMNLFYDAMNAYGQTTNPVGKELYDIQMDYLQKKQSGYDFKLDKKKKKAQKTQQEKPQPAEVKKAPVEKKEEVIIRKGDPEINLQTLMTTEWPEDKYVSIDNFKKQNVNIVFIGHVDAGKSTLTGNIMKELGEVDEQELARNKQQAKQNHMESWELAGIADVDPNERKRGKTVEYAKLNFSLENRRFTVFDAPGHKNYVPNMIMGACQADIAVLIISCKEGQFEAGFEKEGQTKEHAMLAKALGVSGFLVAVTKMGTQDWSQQRFNYIKDQVTPFLENSCGFHNTIFIPIDSINNQNIHKRMQGSWYNGPCLLEFLNSTTLPERKPMGPLRIPIIDRFREVGNIYLYGKVESGTIIEDQTITILPSRGQAVIKEIYNAKDERLPFALAGENVKLKMKGIDENDAKRGDIICNNLNYCQETYEFKAVVNILQIPEAKKLVSSGYECVLHMHAIAEQIEIFKVEAKFDPQTKKNIAATFLKSGEQGTVTIKCPNILCLEKHEFMPSLGRFTLRDEGKTVGYGYVTKIKPAKKLLDEQKEQLGLKKDEEIKVEKQLEKLTVSN